MKGKRGSGSIFFLLFMITVCNARDDHNWFSSSLTKVGVTSENLEKVGLAFIDTIRSHPRISLMVSLLGGFIIHRYEKLSELEDILDGKPSSRVFPSWLFLNECKQKQTGLAAYNALCSLENYIPKQQEVKKRLEVLQKLITRVQAKKKEERKSIGQKAEFFLLFAHLSIKSLFESVETLQISLAQIKKQIEQNEQVYRENESSLNTLIQEIEEQPRSPFLLEHKLFGFTSSDPSADDTRSRELFNEQVSIAKEYLEREIAWLKGQQGFFTRFFSIFSSSVIWLFLYSKAERILQKIEKDLLFLSLIEKIKSRSLDSWRESIVSKEPKEPEKKKMIGRF